MDISRFFGGTAAESYKARKENRNLSGEAALAAIVALYPELVPKGLYEEILRYPIEHILQYYDENSPLFGKSALHDHGKN